jgi:hypothetical protein
VVDLEELLQPVIDDAPPPRPIGEVHRRATALRHRRQIRIAAVLIVGLAMLAAGVAAVVSHRHTARVVIQPPVQRVLRIDRPVVYPHGGMNMLDAFGSIWVSQPDRVARVDMNSGRVLATFPVPGSSDYRNLAAGAGSVWIDDTATSTVTRIDAARNRVQAAIPLNAAPLVVDGMAFVDGKLWVVRPQPEDDSKGDVVAIDPATNRVTAQAVIPRTFGVMGGASHALWYVRDTDLLRFDTVTRRVTVVRGDVISLLAATGGDLWLTTNAGVIAVDERTGVQHGPAIPPPGPVNVAVAVGAGVVWVSAQPDSSNPGDVTPYDATTHEQLAAPIALSGFPALAMTVAGGALWIDANGLQRIPFSW